MDELKFAAFTYGPQREEVTDNTWFQAFYEPSELSKRKDLSRLFVKISDMMMAKEFVLLDELVRDMDVKRLTPLTMMAVLRYSNPARDHMPNWIPAIQRVYDEVVLRGEDADSLLTGLTKYINT